jgi:hypothetical protein
MTKGSLDESWWSLGRQVESGEQYAPLSMKLARAYSWST